MKADNDFLKHSMPAADITNGLLSAEYQSAKWWGDTARMARRGYRKFWLVRGLETKGRYDPDAMHKVKLRRMIEENAVSASPEKLAKILEWCHSIVELKGGAKRTIPPEASEQSLKP